MFTPFSCSIIRQQLSCYYPDDSTIDLEQFKELVSCISTPSQEDMIEALKKFDKEDTGKKLRLPQRL